MTYGTQAGLLIQLGSAGEVSVFVGLAQTTPSASY